MDAAAWKLPVMWDVVEEHLDEAAFLYGQWENARIAPHYTAAEVIDGPEERLLANLDGLVIAGPPAAERLLVPALGEPDAGLVFSAAWALSAIEGGQELLFSTLDWSDADLRGAAARGLELSLAPGLDDSLLAQLKDGPPEHRATLLRVLALRRWPLDEALFKLLDLADPETQRAVMRARWTREGASRAVIDAALESSDAATRDAALAHGLTLRMRSAWDACVKAVETPGPEAERAWLLHALVGDEEALAPLEAALADEATRKGALFALGFSGRARAVELVLPHLADEAVGRIAGEAFSAITGAALVKALAKPPPPPKEEEDGEEEALEVDLLEEELPIPEPEAVAAWWADNRKKFEPRQRYLNGEPLTAAVLAAAIDGGPMRRRAGLALELRIRTEGETELETETWVRSQGRFQAGTRAATRLDFQEPLPRHLVR